MNENAIIFRIRKLRKYPIWAIAACLELNDYDDVKALEELDSMYSVMGDHPEIVIKREEQKLRERLNKFKK